MLYGQRSLITLNFHLTFLSILFQYCLSAQLTDSELIDSVVEKWAPLIWLSPDEKYFPMDVDEFLEHVYPGDADGRSVSTSRSLPLGKSSETLYLFTKKDFELLKTNTSFLNGHDPSKATIPIYVTISDCPQDENSNNMPVITKSKEKKMKMKKTVLHVTYWMFYPYNEGKELCFLGNIPAPFIFNRCLGKVKTIGNHVGDFERVSMSFDENYKPVEIFLSIHDVGAYYRYDEYSKIFRYHRQIVRKGILQTLKFPQILRTFAGRPAIFAARGSHGLWSAPGAYYFLRIPTLYDHIGYGMPWKTWMDLRIYHLNYSKPPIWMKYLGRWGNPKSNCFLFKKLGICEFTDGPLGILRNHQDFDCE